MRIFQFETDAERDAIIQQQLSEGMYLIEESYLFTGNFLKFDTKPLQG